MRQARTLALGLLTALGGIIAVAWPNSARPGAAPGGAGPMGPRVQGVASCAAMACHNANGPKGSKGSEYTTWMAHDPHAKAYAVLFDERSRRMAKNLWPEKHGKEPHAEKEALCLSCHVQPNPALGEVATSPRFALSDGVGCEACHGAAEKWLSTHYTSPELARTQGMTNTKNLLTRVEVCVRCHVGEQDMDVNHDLIAAGHPRLRFEFAAYHANYPKHWRANEAKDFEARAWVLGELVAARAALELLQYRSANVETAKRPWPEFAEYNCAACHHDLKSLPGRQVRKYVPRKVGELPWGSWYYPVLPELAGALPPPRAFDLTTLEKLMRPRRPDEKRVAEAAKQQALALREWIVAVEKAPSSLSRARLTALFKTLAEDRNGLASAAGGDKLEPATWDSATQLYLGLAALNNGLNCLGMDRLQEKRALEKLRDELGKAFPGGHDSLYNTPSKFDPASLEAPMQELRRLLR